MSIRDVLTMVTENWPWPPEEDLALAESLIDSGIEQAPGFLEKYFLLFIFGAVVIGVLFMLLMIAGRTRRETLDESMEESLFGDTFAVQDDDDVGESPFETVVIQEHRSDDLDSDEDNDSVEAADVQSFFDDTVATDDLPIEETEVEPLAADEAPDIVDVVEEPAEREEPEELRRYAYGGEPAEPAGFFGRSGSVAEAAATPQSFAPVEQSPAPAPTQTQEGDGRPYVAPFIREDIDRSERRQTERIDGLREEFARQVSTLKNEQSSRLDLVIAAIDRKLDSLDRRQAEMVTAVPKDSSENVLRTVGTLGEQVDQISSAIDGQGQRIRAITQILETRFAEVGQVFDEVKSVHGDVKSVSSDLGRTADAVGDVRSELDHVKEHVGRLERAILDRAAQDSATTVRLADVIRGTLPEGAYTFGATLGSGETADCLVSFDGLNETVAIDAGFPMEAFHELPSRDAVRRNLPQAKAAEDGFRRAILRSILEAADRCISPSETADSCLLFLPSEAAYTILHDRFPDLVRDSQRARVWLVSPSTLMGTLNLIRNLLPDAEELASRSGRADEEFARREEEVRLREEVSALRRRASGLAEELDRTRGTLRDLISSTERLETHSEGGHGLSRLRREPEELADHPDEDGFVEGLRFDGTPDWNGHEGDDDRPSLFEDRPDTLR